MALSRTTSKAGLKVQVVEGDEQGHLLKDERVLTKNVTYEKANRHVQRGLVHQQYQQPLLPKELKPRKKVAGRISGEPVEIEEKK